MYLITICNNIYTPRMSNIEPTEPNHSTQRLLPWPLHAMRTFPWQQPSTQVTATMLKPQQHYGKKLSTTACSHDSQVPRVPDFFTPCSQLARVGTTGIHSSQTSPAWYQMHHSPGPARASIIHAGSDIDGGRGSVDPIQPVWLALHHSTCPWTCPTPLILLCGPKEFGTLAIYCTTVVPV